MGRITLQETPPCENTLMDAHDPHQYEDFIAAYCDHCPMRQACLNLALDLEDIYKIRHGAWGGTTPQERNKIENTNWKCDPSDRKSRSRCIYGVRDCNCRAERRNQD